MHVGLRAGPRRVAARRRWASAARTSPRRRGLRLAYSHPLRRAFPPRRRDCGRVPRRVRGGCGRVGYCPSGEGPLGWRRRRGWLEALGHARVGSRPGRVCVGLRAESAFLCPPPRHAEAPDITIGGQLAVRVQDGDWERDDAPRDDAQEPHVLREHAGEPQIAPALLHEPLLGVRVRHARESALHPSPHLPRRAAGPETGYAADSRPCCAAPQVRSVIRGHSRWRHATLILTRHFDDRASAWTALSYRYPPFPLHA